MKNIKTTILVLALGLALPAFSDIAVNNYAGLCQAVSTNSTEKIRLDAEITLDGDLPALGASKTLDGNGRGIAANMHQGVEIPEGKEFKVKNLKVSGSLSESRNGSAFSGKEAKLILDNVNCSQNGIEFGGSAPTGGAVYMENGLIKAVNSTFIDNHAGYEDFASQGGAIGAKGGSIEIESCVFSTNYAAFGSAIAACEDASLKLSGTNSFIGNSCMDFAGAAIYSENGDIEFAEGSVNYFRGNRTLGCEGLIYVNNLDAVRHWNLKGCSFVSNDVHTIIRIASNQLNPIYLSDGVFCNNHTLSHIGLLGAFDIKWNGLVAHGNSSPAMTISCENVTLVDSVMTSNLATEDYKDYADNRQVAAASVLWADGNVAITNSVIKDNLAGIDTGHGRLTRPTGGSFGTIAVDNYDEEEHLISFSGCKMEGNSAGFGGVLSSLGSGPMKVVFNDTVFSNNSAYCGGVVHTYGTDTAIEANGCVFSGNYADFIPDATFRQGRGGVIYVENSKGEHQTSELSSLSIHDAVMEGNDAFDGGAVYNEGHEVFLSDVSFIGNTAQNKGGAIYNADIPGQKKAARTVTIEARDKDVEFSKNKSVIDSLSDAIYNEGKIVLSAFPERKITFGENQAVCSSGSDSSIVVKPATGQTEAGLVTFRTINSEGSVIIMSGSNIKNISSMTVGSYEFQENTTIDGSYIEAGKFVFASTKAEIEPEYVFDLSDVFKDEGWKQIINKGNLEAKDASGMPYEFDFNAETGVLSNFSQVPEPVFGAIALLLLTALRRRS